MSNNDYSIGFLTMQNCNHNHMHIAQVKLGLKANGIVGTIESFVELRSFKCCKRINETEKISNIEWRALNQLIKIFSILTYSNEPQLKPFLQLPPFTYSRKNTLSYRTVNYYFIRNYNR